jgi:cell division protein FtsW (lipid II flippase)
MIAHTLTLILCIAGGLAVVYGVIWLTLRVLSDHPFRYAVAVFPGLIVAVLLSVVIALIATDFWPKADWVFWIACVPLVGLVVILVAGGALKEALRGESGNV